MTPEIFLYGSSLDGEGNDIDIIIVSDKPVDVCIYTPREWKSLNDKGRIMCRGRTVLHPTMCKVLRETPLRVRKLL